ncbi:serine hydrolase [Acetobacteraceae bacterium H6797]|nr:serine hydrolase [Acetobacteraceae bacterium H6797]
MTKAAPQHHYPAGEDFLLLSPSEQAFAYRNVDKLFATRAVRRGSKTRALPYGAEIAPRYQIDGQSFGVADFLNRSQTAGLIVLKAGEIRLERYALGLAEATRWSTMSTVKSMTSTLIGAALQDGAIRRLEEPVSTYLPALRGSAYDEVAIRHLLTMSSGVGWNESYTDRQSDVNRYSKSLGDKVPGGVLALMRGLTRVAPPGALFNYNTGDTYVLGCLISAATGMTLADYMSQRIWAPSGMEFDAFYTLESEGGQEIGGSRAGIALRDFARFGAFLLADGVIDGQRVLPEGWVAEAARPAFALDPTQNSYGATGYGYSWWLDPDGAMVAVGFAGQSLYINPADQLVIVTLSCWPQPPYDAAYPVDRRQERLAFKAAVKEAL